MFNDVTTVLDEDKPFKIIYNGFQKALVKVPHKRLIRPLCGHGKKRPILNWISGGEKALRGVPQ